MAKKPEAVFQELFTDGLLREGFHVAEIPDDSKKQYRFGQGIKAEAKPYDLNCLDRKGRFAAIELKAETDSLSWNFSELTDSEEAGLEAVVKRGQLGCIAIRFFFRLGPLQRKALGTTDPFIDQVWGLHFLAYKAMKEDQGYKSFHLVEDADWGHQFPSAGAKKWKISKTLSYLRRMNSVI